jgi:hypothetical protein
MAHPIETEVEQLQRCGIGPMCVLKDKQDGSIPGQALELIKQRREHLAALLSRAQREGGIALTERDREQCGKQGGDCSDV